MSGLKPLIIEVYNHTSNKVMIYENNISAVEPLDIEGRKGSRIIMNSGTIYLCGISFEEWENDILQRKD